MKAIVQDVYGSVDVLELREVPRPAPKPGEVLIRVRAAGVDAGVWHLMTGLPYLLRLMGFGLRAPKVPVRGREAAGRVEEVGAGVTRFRPGDEVFGICEGSFAEYACAPADRFVTRPTALTPVRAAALPISGLTALQALRDAGRVRRGQRVLVIGAAGGVGSYAVQLAKDAGAHVTGLCSAGKADLVRSLGADEVLDYAREDITDGSRRYDLVIDTAGNRPLSGLRRALTPRGTLVIVGGDGGGRLLGGTDRTLRAALLSPLVRHRLRGLVASERPEDLRHLADLAAAGRITPSVDRTYPLSETPQAIARAQSGAAHAKLVITPWPTPSE